MMALSFPCDFQCLMHSTSTQKPTEYLQTIPHTCVILKAIHAEVGWACLARLVWGYWSIFTQVCALLIIPPHNKYNTLLSTLLSFPHQFTLSPPIAFSPSFLLATLPRSILLSSLAILSHCIHVLYSLFEVSIFCTGSLWPVLAHSQLSSRNRRRRKE